MASKQHLALPKCNKSHQTLRLVAIIPVEKQVDVRFSRESPAAVDRSEKVTLAGSHSQWAG